ncbi:hypothetical protein NB646_06950 [Oxalobacter aliiformigenes]|uniref:Rhodanese domain-containing protein n=1 Tax=Oxalobacter aliiformigenes TaxID=2946593 RepID=A0A9E9NSR8_9BURK|nr:hypothetical protein [Oxalobacter aliiformigenes]WAV90601.1 hypothetical protein NB646_06950 [Oxalobacter aliiformigenes]
MTVHGTHARCSPDSLDVRYRQLDRKSVILPLGRSGKRSAGAAEILTVAGFENVFNVLDGFEGDLDGNKERNHVNAWRYRNLPGFLDGMSV